MMFVLSIFIGCGPKKPGNPLYIISKQDSINKIGDTSIPPPPPPPSQKFKWYTNVVFIMDTSEVVYIYQTERIINKNFNDSLVEDYDLPNYIGLKPEYLITFNSKYLLQFIKSNRDIFRLDTNENITSCVFYIASPNDTIKNSAFNELTRFLSKTNGKEDRIHFLIRRTTEEENAVLQYKRKNQEYNPLSVNWSSNFIDGKVRPFTDQYFKTEAQLFDCVKAKETFRKNSIILYPSL